MPCGRDRGEQEQWQGWPAPLVIRAVEEVHENKNTAVEVTVNLEATIEEEGVIIDNPTLKSCLEITMMMMI